MDGEDIASFFPFSVINSVSTFIPVGEKFLKVEILRQRWGVFLILMDIATLFSKGLWYSDLQQQCVSAFPCIPHQCWMLAVLKLLPICWYCFHFNCFITSGAGHLCVHMWFGYLYPLPMCLWFKCGGLLKTRLEHNRTEPAVQVPDL